MPPDYGPPPPAAVSWASRAGGTVTDQGNALVLDGVGYSYVVGEFSKTASFGNTSVTAKGYTDCFVARLDPAGAFNWVLTAGAASTSCRAKDVALDASGHLVVVGYSGPNVTFGGIKPSPTWTSGNRGFVARINPSGVFLWVTPVAGGLSNEALTVALDGAGNPIIAGDFWSTATFGSTTLTTTLQFSELFIAKLDTLGNWVWARSASGSVQDNAGGIAVDAQGNAYVTGWFGGGSTTLGTTTLTGLAGFNLFITRLSSSGNFLWARTAGGSNCSTHGRAVASTTGGAVLVGDFGSSMAGGPPLAATFGTTTLSTKDGTDLFAAKIDATGNFVWATSGGGTDHETAYDIAAGAGGELFLVGRYQGPATFGGFTLGGNTPDVLALRLSGSGAALGAKTAGGTSTDFGYGVALDAAGKAYLTGKFSATGTFGSHVLVSTGSNDVFVWKLPTI